MRIVSLALIIGIFSGCTGLFDSKSNDDFMSSVENFFIEPDKDVYIIDSDEDVLEITYSYVNKSNRTLYPGSCLGKAAGTLEKLVDGEWILAYGPVCPSVLRPPISVEGGEQLKGTIQLSHITWDPEWNNVSWYGGGIEGTYRIPEKVYADWSVRRFDKGELVSMPIVSKTFDIRKGGQYIADED